MCSLTLQLIVCLNVGGTHSLHVFNTHINASVSAATAHLVPSRVHLPASSLCPPTTFPPLCARSIFSSKGGKYSDSYLLEQLQADCPDKDR